MAWIMRVIYRGYDQDLKELFSQSGVVETAVVISDKFSGQSRGFGFVEMADEAGASAAIQSLDSTEFKGRNHCRGIALSRKPRITGLADCRGLALLAKPR
jgi:hypothetical protein